MKKLVNKIVNLGLGVITLFVVYYVVMYLLITFNLVKLV